MARDDERARRAAESPVVGGLPEVPGIGVAMRLSDGLGVAMRGVANALLVDDYPGTTLSRADRELLATGVSAANDCFFCMDSHGAFACELYDRASRPDATALVDAVKRGGDDGLDAKMRALLQVARVVQRRAGDLGAGDVQAAKDAGASDADVQLAVLIASAFCMFNRMVDGLRARTFPTTDAYRSRAAEIADHGYAGPPGPRG